MKRMYRRTMLVIVTLLLLAAVFSGGYYLGQVSIAIRDLRFQSDLNLAIAGEIQADNHARALTLVEQDLRMKLWGISRWGRYTRGWQRQLLYDVARRINGYYETHLPDQLYLDHESESSVPLKQESWQHFARQSNADIMRFLSQAYAPDVVAQYGRESEVRNQEYQKRMLERTLK